MSSNGIPVDKAQLLSSLLEALLYGFSLLMFGGTVAILRTQRTSSGLFNLRMLVVACLLLLFSTAHFVIDTIRTKQGLILFRDTYPGGPVAFFGDVSQWTFVAKNYVYVAQTLLGDGVVIYRCYAVWQSKLVMIVPSLLWCSVLVTGIGSPYTALRSNQNGVFNGSLDRWITSYYVATLSTNLLATILLAYRIWSVDRTTARLVGRRKSRLRHILHVVIDAGAFYSITLFVGLLCFVNHSNGQYVIIDMATPIIAIAFYMVIIRVGLASRENRTMTTFPLKWVSTGGDTELGTNVKSEMQVRVATLEDTKTDTKTENYPPSSVIQDALLDSGSELQGKMKFDIAEEEV